LKKLGFEKIRMHVGARRHFFASRAWAERTMRRVAQPAKRRFSLLRNAQDRMRNWSERFEEAQARAYGRTTEKGRTAVKRVILLPLVAWFFIYRYHDIERDLYLPEHPWSEVDMELGWNGLALCDCDGNRGFSQLESLAQRITRKLRDRASERTVIFDVASGMLLPSYIYVRRILERCPRVKNIDLVVSDEAYSNEVRGVFEIAPGGVTTFSPFPPDLQAALESERSLDITQLWRPSVVFGLLLCWFSTEDFDVCVNNLVREVRNALVHRNTDVTVRLHVMGDITQKWSEGRHDVHDAVAEYTGALADNAFLTHVHFEGANGQVRELRDTLKQRFLSLDEDCVPDPATAWFGMLGRWFDFAETEKPLRKLPSFDDERALNAGELQTEQTGQLANAANALGTAGQVLAVALTP